jgi:hypothetical protein
VQGGLPVLVAGPELPQTWLLSWRLASRRPRSRTR